MSSIGYDLGRTIVNRDKGREQFDGCFDVIKRLTKVFHHSYIISRVNSEQRKSALEWFKDVDFYNQTGINSNNIYFCFERRDKSVFVEGLRINVFIDDRPDVLIPMKDHVTKILFNPYPADLEKERFNLQKVKNLYIVKNWGEVEEILIHNQES